MKTSTFSKLLLGAAVAALAIPASAAAQATRTWVSGVGDDANPCSRTAPCKTFAGAISKTAAKGEINCLDPGGYGGVTITKSLTIKCDYTEGGVLVSGTNAIVVNADATDNVVLNGLDINGLGTSLNGIRILSAKSVKIVNTEIYGFLRNGVDMEASNNGARVLVANSKIFNNGGNGILVAPPSGGNSTAAVRNNEIVGNACAIAATNHLPDPAFNYGSNCGTQTGGVGGSAKINAFGNSLNDSADAGVFSSGQSSIVRVGNNEITGNLVGFRSIDAGQFGGIFSYNDNFLAGNVTDGAPNGTLAKR